MLRQSYRTLIVSCLSLHCALGLSREAPVSGSDSESAQADVLKSPPAATSGGRYDPLQVNGTGTFVVTSFYSKVRPGVRNWRDVRFDIGRTAVMARGKSEVIIKLPVGSRLQKLYLLQCARGDFAGGDRVGTVELQYASGEATKLDLIVGQNTQYPEKDTSMGIGPEGFHVVEIAADPTRVARVAKVVATTSARIHVLAATGQSSETRAPRASSVDDEPVTLPTRKNFLVSATDAVEPAEPLRTRFLPVPLNPSPGRSIQRDGMPFFVHRIPVETTSVRAQRGLRIGVANVVRIHFMHCGRRNLAANEQIGCYEIRFLDGSVERFDLVTQRTINYPDWSRPGSTRSPGDPDGLDVVVWQNPDPTKTLQTVDLVGSNSVTIQLWAVTIEVSGDATPPAGPDPRNSRPVRVGGASTPKIK